MHQEISPEIVRRLPPAIGLGESPKLTRAALTAGEVRSATSPLVGRVGVLTAAHFASDPSAQKMSSSPWAMARLRSVAHLGTTRSGHRCIATWAQSYLPATSSSHLVRSSFCQTLW